MIHRNSIVRLLPGSIPGESDDQTYIVSSVDCYTAMGQYGRVITGSVYVKKYPLDKDARHHRRWYVNIKRVIKLNGQIGNIMKEVVKVEDTDNNEE